MSNAAPLALGNAAGCQCHSEFRHRVRVICQDFRIAHPRLTCGEWEFAIQDPKYALRRSPGRVDRDCSQIRRLADFFKLSPAAIFCKRGSLRRIFTATMQ